MSSSEIQSFLNSKVPSCDTNGDVSKSYYYNSSTGRVNNSNDTWVTTTRKVYGQRYNAWYNTNIAATPFTCLKDHKQNTPAVAAESGICGNLTSKTNRSAALIISDVSNACGINPQSLIVLLQKEQGLVTDSWPWANQYQKATGYGCPDTAPCNSEYYGFFNQVYKAAWQFKKYRANPTNYNYVAGQNNKIYYNPNSSCGYSWVNIQNQATAGLYNYTPYRPNQAALDNLYGTGNSCSAYGNRNFWRYFNEWFGTTTGTPFFRINSTTGVYIIGANNTYYKVVGPSQLKDYGYGKIFNQIDSMPPSYVDSLTFGGNLSYSASFETSSIYLVSEGTVHRFGGQTILNHYGFTVSDNSKLPNWLYTKLRHAEDIQQVLKTQSGSTIYYIENGTRRHIIDDNAYKTLGSPAYSIRAYVNIAASFVSTLPYGAPILTQDTFVSDNTSRYYYYDGVELTQIDNDVAKSSGIHFYKEPYNLSTLLTVSASKLGKYLSDGSGGNYIIDGSKKLSLEGQDLSEYALSNPDFTVAPSGLLNHFASAEMKRLVSIGGQPEIYLIHNGKLHHIPGKTDLYGLGYSFSKVLTISDSTMKLFPNDGAVVLSSGRLVRYIGQTRIYAIDDNFAMRPITSPSLFRDYGFNGKDVIDFSTTQLTSYHVADPLESFVKKSGGAVWAVSNGYRYKVTVDMQDPSRYNLDPATITPVSVRILDSLPQSVSLKEFISAPNDPMVYEMVNGKRQKVTSPTTFLASHSWSDVLTMSNYFVYTLSE